MGIWIFLLASGCFCAGYCLSGMLGYGTREELEREAEELRRETARQKIRKEWIVGILEGQTKKITYKQAVRFARAFGAPYKELFPDTRKIEKIIKKFVEVE